MRDIYLHGALGAKYGKKYSFDINTVGEAIRALGVNFRGFIDDMKQGSYEIVRGNPEKGIFMSLDDVNTFKLGVGDLHIIPVIEGEKSGQDTTKIIIGAAIVGAALIFSGGALAGALPVIGGFTGLTYGSVAMMGISIALAGVSGSHTKETGSVDSNESFTTSGPGNTSKQGGAVPLIYGEVITGGILVSGGLEIENIGAYQG